MIPSFLLVQPPDTQGLGHVSITIAVQFGCNNPLLLFHSALVFESLCVFMTVRASRAMHPAMTPKIMVTAAH